MTGTAVLNGRLQPPVSALLYDSQSNAYHRGMILTAFENFRANVKHVIKTDHLLQKDLADKAGVTASNLTRILRGQSIPGLDTCEAIAAAVGVPLVELIDQPVSFLSDVA